MPKRINQSKIQKIKDLEIKYGNIYDYSKAIYTGYNKYIIIIDKQTKLEFKQKYNSHLKGLESNDIDYKFIIYVRKCILKYNNRYTYSNYKGYNKSVDIYDTIDKYHFEQNAQSHYENGPVKKCLNDYTYFLQLANEKYSNIVFEYIKYDWDKREVHFKYKNDIYIQNIYEHLKGYQKDLKLKLYFEDFLIKANKIHNNEYEYFNFKNTNQPISVKNKQTGKVYKQKIKDILNSCKPKQETIKYTFEYFVEQCNVIHKNRFVYKNYKGINFPVTLKDTVTNKQYTCLACNVLSGSIPKELSFSNVSKTELEILNQIKLLYPDKKIITNYRPKWLNRKELDIYIPDLNLAIEYNGTHYHHSTLKPNRKSLEKFYKNEFYHIDKFKHCLNNNIKLIHIFDFQYKNANFNLEKLINMYLNNDILYFYNVKYFINERNFNVCKTKSLETLTVFLPKVIFVKSQPSYTER